jgi:hypothetical protein
MATMTTISRDGMAALISEGKAHPFVWRHDVGPLAPRLSAAELDGRWFVELIGEDGFRVASAALAALLTAARAPARLPA